MKLTKRVLAEAEQIYSSGKNFRDVANNLYDKFGLVVSPEGIRKRFVRLKTPLRTTGEALRLAKRKHLLVSEIISLYVNQKISLRKLAKKFGSTKATIHKIISENRIRVRDSDEAIRLANLKYERCNFSTNTIEKAHMIGLVEGDITAFRKSKHTVRAITNTTHDSFCNMFNKIFRNYGKVRISPTENKTFENYMWRVSVDLNNSFSFLLPENRRKDICELINSDAKAFLSFLAGYVDAEGALLVKKIRENLQYCLRLSTENLDLLKQIESKLVKLNFRPILYKNFLSGSSRMANKTKISYNKDYFSLELFRKSDIALILKALPLKHPEKIAKKQLILKMIKANLTKWSQAEPLVNQLTTEIKAKTKASIAKAKRLYEAR